MSLPNLFTLAEVAEVLRIDRTTVREEIRSGRLKAYNIALRGINKRCRVSEEEIERYLASLPDAAK